MNYQNFLYPTILSLIFFIIILISLKIRRNISLAFFYLIIGLILALIQFVSFPGYLALLRSLSVGGIPLIPVYFVSIIIITIFIIYEMFDIEISRNYTISLIVGRILLIFMFFAIVFTENYMQAIETEPFSLNKVLENVYLVIGRPLQLSLTLLFFILAIFASFLVYSILRSIKLPSFIASIISIFVGGVVNLMSTGFPLFFKIPQMFFNVFYHLAFISVVLSLFNLILWRWVKGKE